MYLLSLVYNQVISLIILFGAQQGIKHPMISRRNKGMNKHTLSDSVRLSTPP